MRLLVELLLDIVIGAGGIGDIEASLVVECGRDRPVDQRRTGDPLDREPCGDGERATVELDFTRLSCTGNSGGEHQMHGSRDEPASPLAVRSLHGRASRLMVSGLNPSAQHIANQRAASGRVLQSKRAAIAWSNACSGRWAVERMTSRRSDQDFCEVIDEIGKGWAAGTAAEEHPVVAEPDQPGLVQDRDQAATDVRVVSEPIVASNVGLPER